MSEKLKISVVLNSNFDLKIQKQDSHFALFLLFLKFILTLPSGILSKMINLAYLILIPVIKVSVDL